MKLKEVQIGSKFKTKSGKSYIKRSDKDNLEFDWCLPCDKIPITVGLRGPIMGGLSLISSTLFVRLNRNAEVDLL